MSGTTATILLFCFLCATGYIVFGILQMMSPTKALPVYRLFLGKIRFAKNEMRFRAVGARTWKILGACYVFFGMLVAWELMRSFRIS